MPQYTISGFNQGSNFSLSFRATDCAGTPLSLSGYNIRSSIKEFYTSITGIASFDSVITVPESGICNISMTSSGANLPPKIYLYHVQSYLPDESDVSDLLYGHLIVEPQILF